MVRIFLTLLVGATLSGVTQAAPSTTLSSALLVMQQDGAAQETGEEGAQEDALEGEAEDEVTQPPSGESEATGSVGATNPTPEPTEAVQSEAEGNTDLNRSPVDPSTLEFALQGDTVVATSGGSPVWRLPFPEGSGATQGLLESEGELYVGHGNSVLQLNPETGAVEARWLVSGQVESVERVNENTVSMTVEHEEGLSERFTLRSGNLQNPVRFGLATEIFTYLQEEALVENPAARLEQDPTNPWLYLAVGLAEADPNTAQEILAQSVEVAQSFYDLAGLAQVLEENGERNLAEEAFTRALEDFAARGYDPRLLTDLTMQEAYNFPLNPLQEALRNENVISADFWAEKLLLAAPYVPGASDAFASYANLIEDEVSLEEANYWRSQSRSTVTTGLSGLDGLAGSLGNIGWYAALAVFVAILLLHLTLLFKYWIPQSGDIRRQRAEQGRGGQVARLLVPRYYTITEKLVLILMFLVVIALVGLAGWNDRSASLPLATESGTLANRQALAYLERAELIGVRGAFIRGYAEQIAGEARDAQADYETAAGYAPAINNLGVLTENADLFQQAVDLEPNLPEARYNLGEPQNENPIFLFQERYRPDQALLATPSQDDFRNAVSGTWNDALAGAFTNPWGELRGARPVLFSPLLWTLFIVLFFLLLLYNVVFLFMPRARSGRNAPRTLAYQVLAVLVPGSGLADEAWGFFLIVPWAIVSLDIIAQLANWGIDMGFSERTDYIALGVIYLVNLVAFIIEYGSYRRRMQALQAERSRKARAPKGKAAS